jgi:hypothetical protein
VDVVRVIGALDLFAQARHLFGRSHGWDNNQNPRLG